MTSIIGPTGSNSMQPVSKPDPSLRKAAEGFEAVMVRQVIASMRKAKLADAMFGSSATDNFRELADARTAESIAKLGAFGISSLVERQLSPPESETP